MLPEEGCSLAGYAALINVYNLKVPIPAQCAAIGPHHRRYKTEEWEIFTPRHKPDDTLSAHLTFALKYEGIDLGVLAALFAFIQPEDIVSWVRDEPHSHYGRRIWFLYEWLMRRPLDLEDATVGNYVDVLDQKLQYGGASHRSKRHHVRNNLPGTLDFCPLIRRTPALQKSIDMQLNLAALAQINETQSNLLARAAVFLLLQDSRASFEIERENPDQQRAEHWGQVLGKAGREALTLGELERLQKIVLENNRFVSFGLRHEEGFVGMRDKRTGTPMPDHISARWSDLPCLMAGLLKTYEQLKISEMDGVLQATMIAFGFVFIHPFVDGNGRLHRYLMQHILAESGFMPPGIVFPLSAVILQRIVAYRQVLEVYSQPRLSCIEWRATDRGNVEILNETINLYRYFDATPQAEFLYDCLNQAVNKSLPEEIDYLERYDRMMVAIKKIVDMPDQRASLLILFLRQHGGRLSQRARTEEFKALSGNECDQLEKLFAEIFGG